MKFFDPKPSPLFVLLAISVGLLTFLLMGKFLLSSTKNYADIFGKGRVEIHIDGAHVNGTYADTAMVVTRKPLSIELKGRSESPPLKRILHPPLLNVKPQTLIYILFHSALVAFSLMLSLLGIALMIKMFREFGMSFSIKSEWKKAILPILLAILAGWAFHWINNAKQIVGGERIMTHFGIVFTNPGWTTGTISTLVSIFGLVTLFAIALINVIADKISQSRDVDEWKQVQFTNLKGYLNTFTYYAAAMVGGIVIGTFLQRDMIGEYLFNINLIYPLEFPVLYGAGFSVILAIFFIPTLLFISSKNRDVSQEIDPGNGTGGWFKLSQSLFQEFKVVFSILLPFLISLVEAYLLVD